MTRKLVLITFFLIFFHPAKAQLEYALGYGKREIIERDFEHLCELDFDAEFEGREKLQLVLKRAFGLEKIGCLEFKRFIEERISLAVDYFQSDNLITVDSYGKRQTKRGLEFFICPFL